MCYIGFVSYFCIITYIVYVSGQNEIEDSINSIFAKTNVTFQDLYEDITLAPGPKGFGALFKCGEDPNQSNFKCVPYSQCDPTTNTIIEEPDPKNNAKAVFGFGTLDVRAGVNGCDDYMDVCCQIANTSNANSQRTLPDTTNTSTTTPGPSSSPSPPPPPPPPPARNFSQCGIRNPNGVDFKLVNSRNNESEYGEFPWMVALIEKNISSLSNSPFSFCGGSLISDRVVLTAAHCVTRFKTKPNAFKVRVGEWDAKRRKERLQFQEREVSSIIIHDEYDEDVLFYDAAALILSKPVNFDQHIGTICLPQQGQKIQSRNCYANGWGKNVFGDKGQYQLILKKVMLPTVENPRCQSLLRNTRLTNRFILHDSFMCAGGEDVDTCTGDGGGPLACPDPNNPDTYVLTGIVSWGIGCNSRNVPGVYADVSKIRSWIDQQLALSS